MIVNDIIKLAKAGALANLPVASNNDSLMMFVYLGVSVIYQRFNMLIKTETVKVYDETNVCELRKDDVGLVLSLYDEHGRELRPSSITDGKEYDYKQLSYRTFLMNLNRKNKEHVRHVTFVYSASPTMFTSVNDPIDLPVIMIPVLLDYVAYMGHSTVNQDQNNTANIYYQKFDKACNELDMLGYKVTLSYETASIQSGGFV